MVSHSPQNKIAISHWCVSLHLSLTLAHKVSQSLSLSLSLSLSVRLRYFLKIWNFKIDKKNLGWCKNVVHQTYYYFLPFGCWVSILLLGFDFHVLWFGGGDLRFFFFFFWYWRLIIGKNIGRTQIMKRKLSN